MTVVANKFFLRIPAVLVPVDAPVSEGDSYLEVVAKLQGQISNRLSGYSATSDTSNTIAETGRFTFNTQLHLSYSAGARAVVASRANTFNRIEGIVYSYDPETGLFVIDADEESSGSGTFNDWNINIAGNPGMDGMASPAQEAQSWVPTLVGEDTVGSSSYINRIALYNQVNSVCVAIAELSLFNKGGASGAARITGLPIPGIPTGPKSVFQVGYSNAIKPTNAVDMVGVVQPGTYNVDLWWNSAGGEAFRVDCSDLTNSTKLSFAATYIIESADFQNSIIGETGPGYRAMSSSSVVLGVGTKVFEVPTGLAYTPGARVRSSFSTTEYLEGVVTSYTGTTLTLEADYATGSGTHSSWNINLTGDQGYSPPLLVDSETSPTPVPGYIIAWLKPANTGDPNDREISLITA